jgi:DNA-binding transcriptional regulator GbsR (MarR family)
VLSARRELLEGVGRDIAASFPGITRLGGQVVAALYLAEGTMSMDELSEMLGRAKSNVFANLRALEAAGIVERRREAGSRHDSFALKGKYPDVVIGAYLTRLRTVVADKVSLSRRSLSILGDAQGEEAERLRERLDQLLSKYERFAVLVNEMFPAVDGPVDLLGLIEQIPEPVVAAVLAALQASRVTGTKR